MAGLDAISNPFKVINIQKYTMIRDIRSLTSRQEKNKGRKLALSIKPKIYLLYDPGNHLQLIWRLIKTHSKLQLKDDALSFKNPNLKSLTL